MRLQLKQGIDIDVAMGELQALSYIFGNARSLTGRAEEVRDHYIAEVERVEPGLRNYFTDPDVWGHLYGQRYWAIWSMTSLSPRWGSLVGKDAEEQQRYIEQLVEQLRRLKRWLDAAEGPMAVLDTNVLPHYLPVSQIPWSEVLGGTPVRLVLPIRVVEMQVGLTVDQTPSQAVLPMWRWDVAQTVSRPWWRSARDAGGMTAQ